VTKRYEEELEINDFPQVNYFTGKLISIVRLAVARLEVRPKRLKKTVRQVNKTVGSLSRRLPKVALLSPVWENLANKEQFALCIGAMAQKCTPLTSYTLWHNIASMNKRLVVFGNHSFHLPYYAESCNELTVSISAT